MERVLVIGATRGTGLLIARSLISRGFDVRIVARNEAKAKRLFGDTKAELFISDLTAPNQHFQRAFEGVSHIFFTAAVPSGFAGEEKVRQVDYQGVVYALQAAKAANFSGRFYYMNTIGCYHRSLFMNMLNFIKKGLSHWRIEAEKAIQASGLKYTIVRAGILTNSSSDAKPVKVFNTDIPITFTTMISRRQVADVFLDCMNEPRTVNKALSVIWAKSAAPVSGQLQQL